jgi:tRNA/tmRNA/rRNA uracil-C5-methylase (TrmA/RlmC/RlmD family)
MPLQTTEPTINCKIRDIAFGGAGVGTWTEGSARADGPKSLKPLGPLLTVFVPFTIDGETAEIQIVERRRKFSRGKLIQVLEASTHRRTAACPLFTQCGGCDYQHISYEHQLEVKRSQVQSLLQRIAGISITVLPTVASPAEYGFRNRITVHSDGGNIGFFRKGSRSIIDVEQCPLATPAVNLKLQQLRSKGLTAGKHRTLRENDEIRTFTQTNNAISESIRRAIEPHLTGTTLVDAYCGSGYFAHAYAKRFDQVIGIEWNSPALKLARENAFPNEVYIEADVKTVIADVLQKYQPDTLILDPSASGLDQESIAQIVAHPPEKLIYVSCDPATFARDLARLKQNYQIQSVQPFDMFPQTAAIEVLAILEHSRP